MTSAKERRTDVCDWRQEQDRKDEIALVAQKKAAPFLQVIKESRLIQIFRQLRKKFSLSFYKDISQGSPASIVAIFFFHTPKESCSKDSPSQAYSSVIMNEWGDFIVQGDLESAELICCPDCQLAWCKVSLSWDFFIEEKPFMGSGFMEVMRRSELAINLFEDESGEIRLLVGKEVLGQSEWLDQDLLTGKIEAALFSSFESDHQAD